MCGMEQNYCLIWRVEIWVSSQLKSVSSYKILKEEVSECSFASFLDYKRQMPNVLQQTYTMFFFPHIIPQTTKTGIGLRNRQSVLLTCIIIKKWSSELEILQKPS